MLQMAVAGDIIPVFEVDIVSATKRLSMPMSTDIKYSNNVIVPISICKIENETKTYFNASLLVNIIAVFILAKKKINAVLNFMVAPPGKILNICILPVNQEIITPTLTIIAVEASIN